MAFADKYKTVVKSWDNETITAIIQEDLFTGTSEEFKPIGGSPIVIEHQANVNIKESHIIPSQARVSFYVNDEWDCHDLLYSKDRQHKLTIENGSVVIFTGWVVAGVSREDYATGQYVIEVTATDGILDLKDIQYLDSGSLYDAFKNPSVIISECLTETGLTLGFWENINTYATAGMTTTASTHSPLNQSYIHTKAYGEKIEDVLSCYDVLENILQAFYCRLYQTSELDGGNNTVWVISKIDRIGETSTYREWNSAGTTISSNTSYNPSKLIGATYQHVGGRAQISVQQGFDKVNIITDRVYDFNLLLGENFEDDDFPTGSSLTHWDEPDITNFPSTWALDVTKATIDGDTVAEIADYSPDHNSAAVGTVSQDNGSGNVRIFDGNLTTSDYVIIPEGDYKGIYKVTATDASTYFDISATYTTDQNVFWRTVNNMNGIEYIPTSSDLIDNASVDDNAFQNIKVESEYYSNDVVVIVVMAYKSGTDYKVLNNDGEWIDDSTTFFDAIILDHRDSDDYKQSFSLEASLSSGVNNFYSTGTPKLYVGLYGDADASNGANYNTFKVSITGAYNETKSSTSSGDFNQDKDVSFFHAVSDGLDNERLRYSRAIYDDATPKALIGTWTDGTFTNDLEVVTRGHMGGAYRYNSQIWSGQIKGDVDITDAITIPLNLDRQYQIQRISRNLVNTYNSVSLIEIDSYELYYVELASDVGANYIYLSSAYGNISTSFTVSDTIRLSDLRNKSTGVIVLSGGESGIDSSTFTGGRTRLELADLGFAVSPGASLEVKGVLRKI